MGQCAPINLIFPFNKNIHSALTLGRFIKLKQFLTFEELNNLVGAQNAAF